MKTFLLLSVVLLAGCGGGAQQMEKQQMEIDQLRDDIERVARATQLNSKAVSDLAKSSKMNSDSIIKLSDALDKVEWSILEKRISNLSKQLKKEKEALNSPVEVDPYIPKHEPIFTYDAKTRRCSVDGKSYPVTEAGLCKVGQ